jgi:two-component system C4-dicarboxylate transport response regulator DctD
VEYYERTLIVEELRRKKGDQAATAAALGIARQTLHDKLRRLGITADEFKL